MHFSLSASLFIIFRILHEEVLDIIDIGMATKNGSLLDVGSYDVNGNVADVVRVSPFNMREYSFLGADFSFGPNVDVVLTSEESWPFINGNFDIVTCVSVFEHSDFFWETFLSISFATKPGGLIVITVPVRYQYHAHPVDNWRFFPDSPYALQKWAKKNGEYLELNIFKLQLWK